METGYFLVYPIIIIAVILAVIGVIYYYKKHSDGQHRMGKKQESELRRTLTEQEQQLIDMIDARQNEISVELFHAIKNNDSSYHLLLSQQQALKEQKNSILKGI